ETQTNYFLNHWVPNLRGATLNKKKALMPNEPHAAARMIIIDPRRTVTVNACEVEAGKDNVLHLAINSGADLVLFNALFTYIADKGWAQKDFIEKSTFRRYRRVHHSIQREAIRLLCRVISRASKPLSKAVEPRRRTKAGLSYRGENRAKSPA